MWKLTLGYGTNLLEAQNKVSSLFLNPLSLGLIPWAKVLKHKFCLPSHERLMILV